MSWLVLVAALLLLHLNQPSTRLCTPSNTKNRMIQFKNHGISLRRDSEVSITHGMFMNSRGAVTYMDNDSTNGSEVDG